MQGTMVSDQNVPAAKSLGDRFDVIVELLEALQALPADLSEVKVAVDHIEHDNE